jgi:hypothetical protein
MSAKSKRKARRIRSDGCRCDDLSLRGQEVPRVKSHPALFRLLDIRLHLGPGQVDAHDHVERAIGRRRPIALQRRTERFVLDVKSDAAVGIALEPGSMGELIR